MYTYMDVLSEINLIIIIIGLDISTVLTADRCVNNEKHADKMPPIFRWSNAKDCNIKEYGKCSAVHLDRIHTSDSCTCTNPNCSNRQHITDIDDLFDDICNALSSGPANM